MNDLMPIQPENRVMLLEILGQYGDAEVELARFLSWMRSKDVQFEGNDVVMKQNYVSEYINTSYGPTPYRTGRD